MGRVLVTARIENVEDLYAVELGVLRQDQVRVIEVDDAIIGTGASMLSMPTPMIARLGLDPIRPVRVQTAKGQRVSRLFGLVKLTIQGRECPTEVVELLDEEPVLIGRILLEAMDWVVDPKTNSLVGNPAHGGEWMGDLYTPFDIDPNPAS
jgi:predicted aspartyl protease